MDPGSSLCLCENTTTVLSTAMKNSNDPKILSPHSDVEECVKLLQALYENPDYLMNLPEDLRITLLRYAGLLSRPGREDLSKRRRAKKRIKKEKVAHQLRVSTSSTGIRSARTAKVFEAPLRIKESKNNLRTKLTKSRPCYVCNQLFDELHHFYDALCPECAEYNYQKRYQTADLSDQVALITGARLKIGYQATLQMLRAGAIVIATSRFPVDAATRYSKETDFVDWHHRLHIYGLDLRHSPSVELFTSYVKEKYARLDLLLNNAAQTVRRPSGFYAHLMQKETAMVSQDEKIQILLQNYSDLKDQLHGIKTSTKNNNLPVSWQSKQPGLGISSAAQLSQIPYSFDKTLQLEEVFPAGQLDADLQQVDLRKTNSWRLRMGEIESTEMIEVQLVNAIAPFILTNKLTPLMKKENTGKKHIVNVTAMEGKFHRFKKSDRHPHTNMAKAALNMMTHTSASDLARYGIYMNAVDTGWVTDEDPVHLSEFKQKIHDFQPPLDIVDGAARICDPFFDGIKTGKHWCGKFLKDYFPIDW